MQFSVITVTRNNLEGLQRTHRSLLAQNIDDYEWIVIDGASGDGTQTYLHSTQAIWVSESDCGIYDAMNKGISRASGDYLVFMNAGDEFASPDVLGEIRNYAGAGLVYGDALEGGALKRARSHEKSAFGMFTHHQAMVYNRRIMDGLRYDTSYNIAADYKFTLEFLRRAETIIYCSFPVCIFEPGGVSQQQVRQGRREQFKIRDQLRTCSLHKNMTIYFVQAAGMLLRRTAPGIYWRLKAITRI